MYIDDQIQVQRPLPRRIEELIEEVTSLDSAETWMQYEWRYQELYIQSKSYYINEKMTLEQFRQIEDKFGNF